MSAVQDVQPSRAIEVDCSRTAESATGPPALTVRECCASLNFWLLFTIFGIGTGLGLMFVNNLGESTRFCHKFNASAPHLIHSDPSQNRALTDRILVPYLPFEVQSGHGAAEKLSRLVLQMTLDVS